MLSRRRFLLGSLTGLGLIEQGFLPALSKKKHLPSTIAIGPHIIARQLWASAIPADFVGIIDNQYCCVAAECGRSSVADLAKTEHGSNELAIVAELNDIGTKIIDFTISQNKAYVLVEQRTESSDAQFVLRLINFAKPLAPSIVLSSPLEKISDCSCLTVNRDLVAIVSTALKGDSVLLYSVSKGRKPALTFLSAFDLDEPVKSVRIVDRTLVVLQNSGKLSLISLAKPANPKLRKTITLGGNYLFMDRMAGAVVLAGTVENASSVQIVNLSEKSDTLPPPTEIPAMSSVVSIAAQQDGVLVLGESLSGGRLIISYKIDRAFKLSEENIVRFPKEKTQSSGNARLTVGDRVAYVASGWSGLQMLSLGSYGWESTGSYAIPRLPASGIATWENFVVMAGADLKLYDIAHPENPSLVASATTSNTVRAVAGAGSFILCLSGDSLSLRKIDKLDEVVAKTNAIGTQLCFDPVDQKAYLLKEESDKTVATQFKIYSNSIIAKNSLDLKAGYSRAFAYRGELLAGSLNDMALYAVREAAELIGTFHLDNLALRDFVFNNDNIFATAIDKNSQGFLLILSKDKEQLKQISSLPIPHDGVALAINSKMIATVGRTSEGKDLVTLIDISSPALPKVIKSLPAPESASSVTIKDKLAIIAGRGLEIVSLP